MTDDRQRIIEDLYQQALDLPGSERERFLLEHCHDSEIRGQVLTLLAHYVQAGDYFIGGPPAGVQLSDPALADPDQIGAYRILQRIGEGGFGIVYVAEQTRPVRRRVALKILKAGMDTKAVLARFEAERQALALMDHPNIARVLDAGATDGGRPFFVMEWVKGEPLTDYCDRHRLTTRQRLELFIPVCMAVQHAHQKGIVHRDLKPSNIMVTVIDGQPVPKVIDFGIAKATVSPLTDHTVHTLQGQVIGTPAYMSPEQAEMTGLDVDTTSDVYSLGVILYELLAGRLPFDPRELQEGGLAVIQRVIREVEPPRPSSRVVESEGDTLQIAHRRRSEPRLLTRELRGEIDWIVMRAIEKDRTLRYQTANALTREIERYLADEPVEAGPPSATYRLRKYARRNRVAFTVAAAILFGIIGVAAGLSVALIESNRQRLAVEAALGEAEHARAESEAVTQFLSDMLSAVDPAEMGRDVTIQELLAEASRTIEFDFDDQPLTRARLETTIGVTYRQLGDYEQAERHITQGLDTRVRLLGDGDPATLVSKRELGWTWMDGGAYVRAESMLTVVVEGRREVLGPAAEPTLHARLDLGSSMRMQERAEDAAAVLTDLLGDIEQSLGQDHQLYVHAVSELAGCYQNLGRYEEAETHLVQAVEMSRRRLGDDHIETIYDKQNLGALYREQGRYDEALPLYYDSAMDARRLLGEKHPMALRMGGNLALLYSDMGRYAEAESLSVAVLEARREVLGDDNPSTVVSSINLALLYLRMEDPAACEQTCRRILEITPRTVGEDHLYTITTRSLLGASVLDQGRAKEAEAILRPVVRTARRVYPEGYWRTGAVMTHHGASLTALGRYEEAEAELTEAHAILTAAFDDDHNQVRRVMERLIELYEATGKTAERDLWLARLEQ